VEKIPVIGTFHSLFPTDMRRPSAELKKMASKIIGPDLNSGSKPMRSRRHSAVPALPTSAPSAFSASPILRFDRRPRQGGSLPINVSDIQDEIETAVGASSQRNPDWARTLISWSATRSPIARRQDIANIRISGPSGERVSIAKLCESSIEDGASIF